MNTPDLTRPDIKEAIASERAACVNLLIKAMADVARTEGPGSPFFEGFWSAVMILQERAHKVYK